jgi:hypothetical protein
MADAAASAADTPSSSVAVSRDLAARSRRTSRVTLVERDRYPDAPEVRKGTPQARHVHVLLKNGEAAIERLLPGFFDEIEAAGGQRVDTAGDARWHYFGDWKARFESGIEMVSQSRALLEFSLRRRIGALANVETLEGDVLGLLPAAAGQIAGARVRRREARDDAADLASTRAAAARACAVAGGHG